MSITFQGNENSTVYANSFQIRSSHTPEFPNHQQPTHRFKAILDRICQLKANWDGYGALPVEPGVMRKATEALGKFVTAGLPPDDVTPRSPGTIAFVWENDGREAEIEIGKTRYVGFVEAVSSSPVYLQGRSVDIDAAVVEAVRRLYRSPVTLGFTKITGPRWLGIAAGVFVPA